MTILISGTISAVSDTSSEIVTGPTNLLLVFIGAKALIELQRSFDGGVTWHVLSINNAGHPACYRRNVNLVFNEPESGVKYRLSCIEHTAGTINYRISQ